MINVGIIGYGKMGQIRYQVMSKIEEVNVVSIYDPENSETETKQVENHGQIINNPKIDAVIICTPNYLNKLLTIQSLRAGKNVFCEKPPAFTAKEIEEIRSVEKASGKVLMYGFNHRHHESILHMKKLIDKHEYGKVLWMRGRYGKGVDGSFYNNWSYI